LVTFSSADQVCTEVDCLITCVLGELAADDSVIINIVMTAVEEGIAEIQSEFPSDNDIPNLTYNIYTIDTSITLAFYYFDLPIFQNN
jgi:hypothetical protein